MSSSLGATHFSFSSLLEIKNVESASKTYKITLTAAFATSPVANEIREIESPERIEVALEYWNANQEQEFINNGYFICVGTLWIRPGDSEKPELMVKAIQALVWVSKLSFWSWYLSHTKTRCPGDPIKTTYLDAVPLLGPAMLDFIGTAVLFEKHGDNQYFCLQVWHYVGTKGDNKNKHVMANIWARVPPTARWKNTKLPQAGHNAQIQGILCTPISLTWYETLLSTR